MVEGTVVYRGTPDGPEGESKNEKVTTNIPLQQKRFWETLLIVITPDFDVQKSLVEVWTYLDLFMDCIYEYSPETACKSSPVLASVSVACHATQDSEEIAR